VLPSKTAPHARDFCPGLAALLCYYGFLFPAGILLSILLLSSVLYSPLRVFPNQYFLPSRPDISQSAAA
jgi:hypothetical protein